jgi:hypothetical protein
MRAAMLGYFCALVAGTGTRQLLIAWVVEQKNIDDSDVLMTLPYLAAGVETSKCYDVIASATNSISTLSSRIAGILYTFPIMSEMPRNSLLQEQLKLYL